MGYASGNVELVAADSGQVLIRKQFHPSRVLQIRFLRSVVNPAHPLMAVLSVPRLSEVLVIYEGGVVAVVEGSTLFTTLAANRNETVRLAKGQTSKNFSNLPARKLITDGQG